MDKNTLSQLVPMVEHTYKEAVEVIRADERRKTLLEAAVSLDADALLIARVTQKDDGRRSGLRIAAERLRKMAGGL